MHAPVDERDLAVQRGGEAEHHAGTDLRLDRVGIDHLPEVGHDDDAVHFDHALCDGNFRHLRHERVVAFHQRDAARPALCRRRAPVGFVCGLLEHGDEARLLLNERHPVGIGILTGGHGEFIDEAFVGERIQGMADGAPVTDAQSGVVDHEIVRLVRDGIRRDGGLDHECIERVLREAKRALRDRLRRELERERDWPAGGVEPGLESVQRHRAVEVVRHVVFARPEQLHRFADCLGNLRRLHDEIQIEAAAKTPAQEGRLDGDILGLELQRGRHGALRALLKLRRAD